MTKRPSWFPHPVAWLSGGLLFLFLCAFSAVMGFVIPRLFDLIETWPRLAMLGLLLTWFSPIAAIAAGHHAVRGVLEGLDGRRASDGWDLMSLWAGFYAWLAIFFTSSFTSLLMLVVDPPRFDGASTTSMWSLLAWPANDGAILSVRAVLWIAVAAQAYSLERAMKERLAKGATP